MREGHRGAIEVDIPWEGRTSAVHGAPLYGLRRLHLADAITTADPGTRLSSALVDLGEGNGIDAPMTGSWGSTDWSGAYPYAVWPLRDLYGRSVGGSVNVSVPLYVRLRTTLADTDDFAIGLAIINEDVLTGTTVDGRGIHIVGNGASGSGLLRTGNVNTTNGTGTVSNAAAAQAGVVCAAGFVSYVGIGASQMWSGAIGLDTNGARVANSGATPLGATMTATPAAWYLAAFWGRNDATNVGALAHLAADFYVGPIVQSPLVSW